jgi:zinc protease
VDPGQGVRDLPASGLAIAPVREGVVDRGRRRSRVQFALHVGRFPKQHLLSRPEGVERDPEGHCPQPRVEPDSHPREAIDSFHHLRIGLAERILGHGLRAETGEENASVERRAIAMEQLADRRALPCLCAGDETSLALESAFVARPPRLVAHARQTNGQGCEEGHDSFNAPGAPRLTPAARAVVGCSMRAARILPLAICATLVSALQSAKAADVSIPFTKTVLPNGITIILSEDHTLPVVAVNVGYRVGSRVEEAHRTGFAHLFEHLMFMGTRRAPRGDFDARMEAVGGSSNAWTSEDRTDYEDDAPSGALGLLLWLEADRMRDIGPLITKEKLDLQRDVVRNERREESENQPYGVIDLHLPGLLFPEPHPYHHPVIGSHEDLEAARADEVKAFFAAYYDPANASLSVAGDFDSNEAMTQIQTWFSTIPSRGKPLERAPSLDPNATVLKSIVRETVPDDVELARITMAWQAPKHFAPGDAELDLLADILTKGKESRLSASLVYALKLAQEVRATGYSGVLASRFTIDATARPGVSLDRLEAALDAELAKVRSSPVTGEELARAKNGIEAAFVERIQSPSARATILNDYEAEIGDPGFAQNDLDRYRNATAAGVREVAERVLVPSARVIFRVVPKGAPGGWPPSAPAAKPRAGGPK